MTDQQPCNDNTKPEEYVLGPDSLPQEGVPVGTITKRQQTSRIFPGAVHDWWVHVPAQYDPGHPACVMVFQDGEMYKDTCKVPPVMENLIHRKELPVIISIFINPGVIPGAPPPNGLEGNQRSLEYDTLGGRYASFLMEEILPEVAKEYNLRTDAAARAICGCSSGGICAFTVAWERPDAFSKVLSHVGSFADMRGGHLYPSMIRRAERKPIRVFLQTGTGDLDVLWGNWPLANQTMAAALKFKEYDYNFVLGHGAHDPWHGACIMPETLRWLWRE
jgi:enterochelin esterase-like enzyme